MTFPARRSVYGPKVLADPTLMPVGNIADVNGQGVDFTWTQRFTEDFLTPVSPGGIVASNGSRGSDGGLLATTCAAFSAYGDKWKVKADGLDTDHNAQYNAQLTSSIANSRFRINCHQSLAGDVPASTWVGGAIKPRWPTGTAVDANFYTYGRVSYRVHAVADVTTGGRVTGTHWGTAILMINDNTWPSSGEWDFLEGTLDSLNIGGFYHYANPAGGQTTIAGIGPFSTWHTITLDWMPDSVAGARQRIYADGNLVRESTNQIAAAPMTLGFLMQVGSNGGVPTGTAQFEVDWMTMYSYTP